MDNKIQMFEDKRIRTAWNKETEEWYFSVVAVVYVLTESTDGRKYWNKLKQRLKEEGNEMVINCHQLKTVAADGKRKLMDVADTEATTTELSKAHNPQGFEKNSEIAKRGGKYAGNARKEIETDTGRSVITSKNAAELNQVITDLIEGVAEEKK